MPGTGRRRTSHVPAPCYDGVFMKRILTLLVVAPLALWSVSCKKADAPKPAAAPATAAAPGNPPPGVPGAPPAAKPMPPQIPDVLARVNG